jgi:hypothetical protein
MSQGQREAYSTLKDLSSQQEAGPITRLRAVENNAPPVGSDLSGRSSEISNRASVVDAKPLRHTSAEPCE